jgi:hypothetical protein
MPTTPKFCIFDFETLSTKQTAIVLSLGMIVIDSSQEYTFEELEAEGFYVKFDVKEQSEKFNRHVSKDTLEWWKGQGDAARTVLKPSVDDVSIRELPGMINEYLSIHKFDTKNNHAYCRGHFDFPILQDIYENLKTPCPIPFWMSRDLRTYIDTSSGSKHGKVKGFRPNSKTILHNALHDCVNEYFQIVKLHQDLDNEI